MSVEASNNSSATGGNPGLSAKIAIVDDEPINIKIVRKHLQVAGYQNFVTTSDAPAAAGMILREQPDVVLLDVMMPQVDGIQILRAIRADEQVRHIPVLILTASTDDRTKLSALNAGATDFLAKPVDPNDLAPRIRNALVVKAHHDHLANYSVQLERQVQLRTAELECSWLHVVHGLARAGEYRDDTTGRHVIRVSRYAMALSRELGFDDSTVRMLGTAALLHDVGKIGLPDAILLKPGPLEPAERSIMQRHCEIGGRIIESDGEDKLKEINLVDLASATRQPLLDLAHSIAMTHHEKWDGTGYTRRLAGEQIPIEGRIVAVADVFDALSSTRPYKAAIPLPKCIEIMEKDRGRHFDPAVLDALHRRMDDVVRIYAENADVRAAA